MNFKDSYKQANQEIKPDEVFMHQLTQQLKQEQRAVRNRKKYFVSTGVVAAAAVMCVVVLKAGAPITQPETQDVQSNVDVVETPATGHGFGHDEWYGDAETPEEMFGMFQTLLQEEEIKTLYCSDTEVYEEENILLEEEVEYLVEKLCNAESTDEEMSGACKYYMVVFADGNIVKFEIYGEQYLKLKDSDAIYSL